MEIYYKTGDLLIISEHLYFLSYIKFIIFIHVTNDVKTCIYVDDKKLIINPLEFTLTKFKDLDIHYMGICGKTLPTFRYEDFSNIYEHDMIWVMSDYNPNNDLNVHLITKLLIMIGIKIKPSQIETSEEFIDNIDNILIDNHYIQFLIN